jgi:O-antigen ligase
MIPIIIALSIVPLIVHLKILEVPGLNMVWSDDATVTLLDVYTFYKGIWLIIAAILALAIYLYSVYKRKEMLPLDKAYYLLYSYIVLIILSFIFSINRSVSFIGYNEHFENIFVLIAYVLLFIYTSQIIRTHKEINFILYTWIGAIIIMFLIGLGQFFGADFFMTSFGKSLVVPSSYSNISLELDSDAVRNVSQTLFHYNYVSFYAAIALPFFFVLGVLEKNIKMKLIYIGVTLIMVFNQFASLSRNGFVGIIVALIFAVIFLRKQLLKRYKIILPVTALVVIGAVIFLFTSDSVMVRRIQQGFDEIATPANYSLNSIELTDDTIIIDHDKFYITMAYTPEETDYATPFTIYDEENNPINYTYSQEVGEYVTDTIGANTFKFVYTEYENDPVCYLTIGNTKWLFFMTEDGMRYRNEGNYIDTMPAIDAFGFDGFEKFASARGYIWSRSLPLILNHPLLGSGPDTFPLIFPQNDYVGKLNAYGSTTIVVDKPHNIYLDYALNTGLPSLLVLLIFWGIYIVRCFKLYFKSSLDSFYSMIGVASLTAVTGYLASGLFNDTNQNVTPAFWIILGIGFAVNKLYTKEKVKTSH